MTQVVPPPSTAKGRRTRRRIVAAAADLMHEQGSRVTTLGEIQRDAGVSASQLYHYFDSKAALVRAVIELREEGVVGAQERALARVDSLTALRDWTDAVVAFQRASHCRGGCPIGSLGSELAEIDPDARFDVAAGFQRWIDAVRDALGTIRANGELSDRADVDHLAVAMMAALQGGLLLGQVQRTTKPLRVALDAMLELVASYSVGGEHSSAASPDVHVPTMPEPHHDDHEDVIGDRVEDAVITDPHAEARSPR